MMPISESPTASDLTILEKALLFSADETGFIPLPEGNYSEVCLFCEALARLEEKRHIRRRQWNGCRAFFLTKSGEDLKGQLLATGPQTRRGSLRPSGKRFTPRRKLLLLLPAFLLLGAVPSPARLGESPNRVEARYGAPVKVQNGARIRDFECTYKHAGFTVVVHFLDEKSQCESYVNDSGVELSQEEIQRLLEVNRHGGKWKRKEDVHGSQKWDLNSGEATATYQTQADHALEIRTSWWDHYVADHPVESVAGISERLKDF